MNIIFLLKPKSVVAHLSAKSSIRQGLGCYVGCVTEGDFLWYLVDRGSSTDIKECEDARVIDIINKERTRPVKINATIDELLEIAVEQNFAPVVDDRGVFVGIVTRSDVIKYLARDNTTQSVGAHVIA